MVGCLVSGRVILLVQVSTVEETCVYWSMSTVGVLFQLQFLNTNHMFSSSLITSVISLLLLCRLY